MRRCARPPSGAARRQSPPLLHRARPLAARSENVPVTLRREADAPQQILKAWLRVQIIPLRLDQQKNHFRVSLLEPALQPAERFLALAQAVINERDQVRRDVTFS